MTIYLYIKQHSVTGLKYFGKTIKPDPFKYNGSGTKWVRHIKKHGRQYVKTLDVFGFDIQEDATNFALDFSKQFDISHSNEWANLHDEDALDGRIKNVPLTLEHRQNISKSLKGKSRIFSQSHIENLRKPKANFKPMTDEAKAIRSQANKQYIQCPHCDKLGGISAMKRYHFDNCKLNLCLP